MLSERSAIALFLVKNILAPPRMEFIKVLAPYKLDEVELQI